LQIDLVMIACVIYFSLVCLSYGVYGLNHSSGFARHLFMQPSMTPGPQLAEKLSSVMTKVAQRGQTPMSKQPASKLSVKSAEANETLQRLAAAQRMFNEASDIWSTAQLKKVEHDLENAALAPVKLDTPQLQMPSHGEACTPDVSQCPNGWSRHGLSCVAPATYIGDCPRSLDVFRMNINQRLAVATECRVSFPCQADCDQDFRVGCPVLWRETKQGNCIAPESYDGPCNHALVMRGAANEVKYALAQNCAVRWPCQDLAGRAMSCPQNFSSACPTGWFHAADGECVAPPAYETCAPRQRFAKMTLDEKATWSLMCRAPFPCVLEVRRQCAHDWTAACPVDWYLTEDLACVAPRSYQGACDSVLYLNEASVGHKQNVAKKCDVSWPCV